MGELGLTAAPLPEAVGGGGFSYLGWTLVMEELGAADTGISGTLSVHLLSDLSADAPSDRVTEYRLSGTKIWISNAPDAERYLVFATLDPALGPKGITAFLLEKGAAGFRVGARREKMG